MGALTDNRKRCLVDLCVPLSSSASLGQLQSEGSPDVTQLKRRRVVDPFELAECRTPLLPPLPAPSLPPQQQAPVQSSSRSFPDPCPLRRPVHGPQRIITAFGRLSLADSEARVPLVMADRKERDAGMGKVGAVWWSVKRPSPETSLRSRGKGEASVAPGMDRRLDDEGLDELNFEDYKRLVESTRLDRSVEDHGKKSHETSSLKTTQPQSVSSAVHDVMILTEEEDASPYQHISNRRVEEAERSGKIDPFPWQTESDLLGPFTPLTDEEEEEVSLALRDCDKFHLRKHEILVLHEGSNIEITRDVIQCLRHGAWLNDEVINLYFELLKEREKREPKKFLKCHFFNTFFYKKLTGGRGSYEFKAVRRWTTQRKLGYGLIECDKIFVPIHKEIHWCLAVIDVKNEKLLYLDSLGGWDRNALGVLARYLVDEVKDKSNRAIDVTSWKQEPVGGLPLQKNGWDCGMFMLKYADFISRGLGLCFQQDNMTYFRKRTAKEILRLRAE
ncbi:unnamed protein product [Spirodela intermedia]|uniref:Ubiquitin-like protease family profile domain-containing protein n=1 Tax=Spirodela intermedia TaxID=51605 RepID=A0A7I8J0V8_SPIIN|nr:unnamed protein product [Spirodela intermedia]CAA6663443.1 unnamed protein product [Spirodela intermedia]